VGDLGGVLKGLVLPYIDALPATRFVCPVVT
jgi:hypothetical protein